LNLAFDRGFRPGAIEPQAAAGERLRVDTTENQIRVGHRRLAAAAPVARRPRLAARALRADGDLA